MKKRMARSVGAIVLCTSMVLASCGGKPDTTLQVDETKSQLYISTRNSGIGIEWLQKIADEFEKKYANVSFEDGKLGVQVIDEPDAAAHWTGLLSSFPNQKLAVVVDDCVTISAMSEAGVVKDMADVVKGTMNFDVTDKDGNVVSMGETSTIESKLFDRSKEYLGETGAYYGLPWTFSYPSLPYNATLWEDKMLYFADDKANAIYLDTTKLPTSTYTGKAYTGRGFITDKGQDKSPGPDGEYGTYDDGMPSTYEEFAYVLDYMVEEKGIAPFICFSGGNYEYTNKFYAAFACSYDGAEDLQDLYDGKTREGNKVEIVTGWNGNDPIVEDVAISLEEGYKFSQRVSKYYALDLLKKTLAQDKYRNARFGDTSHMNTQNYFIQSTLEPGEQPIAMLLEGSYWYYEAKTNINAAIKNYGSVDDMKVLPIPRQLTGTVEEGKGTVWALPSELNVYMYMNGNVTGVTEKLAKLFVRFAYTDDMLAYYTEITSLPVAVKYSVGDRYENFSAYGKDQWDIYQNIIANDAIVFPYSTSKTYKNNPNYFNLMSHEDMWKSVSDATAYTRPYRDFSSVTPIPVKSWFTNSYTTADTWTKDFLK